MERQGPRDLLRYFDELEEPGMKRTRLHRLDEMIAIAILAVICGADGWVDIEQFGEGKHDWLKTFFGFAQRHSEPRHRRPGVCEDRSRGFRPMLLPLGAGVPRSQVAGLDVFTLAARCHAGH